MKKTNSKQEAGTTLTLNNTDDTGLRWRVARLTPVHTKCNCRVASWGESCEEHWVGVLRSPQERQMLPFLVLFGTALCGYALGPIYCWPVATLGLMSASWAKHYLLIRRGVEVGLDDVVGDALLRSSFNALVVTGACYWIGVAIRSASFL